MPFVPKYLLKRLFPEGCLGLVDSSGKGHPDALLIEGINFLAPIDMPKTVNLGKYSVSDAEKFGRVTIDGVPMKLDANTILSTVSIAIRGKVFTLEEVLQGKAAKLQIALGEKIQLLVKLASFPGLNLQPGKHKIAIEFKSGEGDPFLFDIDRELTPERMNVSLI